MYVTFRWLFLPTVHLEYTIIAESVLYHTFITRMEHIVLNWTFNHILAAKIAELLNIKQDKHNNKDRDNLAKTGGQPRKEAAEFFLLAENESTGARFTDSL